MSEPLEVLVIDDMRIAKPSPTANYTHAVTPQEGIAKLFSQHWNIVCFDHDLGVDKDGKTLDIWPVIRAMENQRKAVKQADFICYVISSNPIGAERIKKALENLGLLAIIVNDRDKANMFEYRQWEDMTGY